MTSQPAKPELALPEALVPGNRLYAAIVERLKPYFPANSRDLEWDVLPRTLQAEFEAHHAAYKRMPAYAKAVDGAAADAVRLAEENQLLTQRVRELEKTVADLSTIASDIAVIKSAVDHLVPGR